MKKIFSKTVVNPEGSQKAALQISEKLQLVDNFSCFLQGGLGAGKTFLVREILSHLGISQTVASPTYNYFYEYETENQDLKSDKKIAHFDFYRLENPADFFAKGFEETVADPEISCFTEWFEKIDQTAKEQFSGEKFLIKISFGVGAGMRKIEFFKID